VDEQLPAVLFLRWDWPYWLSHCIASDWRRGKNLSTLFWCITGFGKMMGSYHRNSDERRLFQGRLS
jgi:hypothetical protein